MPLFYRVNSTEWMEESAIAKEKGSWDVDETIRFAKLLPALGVDLLDVSSGANNEKQGRIMGTDDQVQIAGRIRKEIKFAGIKPTLFIGAVGMIKKAERARDIVQGSDKCDRPESFNEFSQGEEAKQSRDMLDGDQAIADVVLVARQFMREPEWVLRVAWQLGVEVQWPVQFRAPEIGRGMD
jgi:2,4-dienoyl-CoA reductase-like NADH-dependent reductase (Old Yellow Enzyme family)